MSESVVFTCLVGLGMMILRRRAKPPLDLTDDEQPIQDHDDAAVLRIDSETAEPEPASTLKHKTKSIRAASL